MKYIIQMIAGDYLEIEKFRGLINIGNLNKNRHKIKFIYNDLIKLFDYITSNKYKIWKIKYNFKGGLIW